jgi:four helix bundle protein
MRYIEWEQSIPEAITADSLWKMRAYRLALFGADIGWHDVTKLAKDHRTLRLSGQLYEALGSVGANLAEGYSRGTGKDRARFYEYSLGSARESRDWYFKGRHILGDTVAQHRMQLLSEIIRLLLAMVPQQRGHHIRETTAVYDRTSAGLEHDLTSAEDSLAQLLEHIPMSPE